MDCLNTKKLVKKKMQEKKGYFYIIKKIMN